MQVFYDFSIRADFQWIFIDFPRCSLNFVDQEHWSELGQSWRRIVAGLREDGRRMGAVSED